MTMPVLEVEQVTGLTGMRTLKGRKGHKTQFLDLGQNFTPEVKACMVV